MNGKPVAFCAVMHFPHPKVRNIKRIHRLVTLPDYQGVGIGTRLLNVVADHYKKQHFRVRIITSTPALKHTLPKQGWVLATHGREIGKHYLIQGLNKTLSGSRVTMAFEYIGVSQ
jgi:GNAT superfamily N-acetyltransferase